MNKKYAAIMLIFISFSVILVALPAKTNATASDYTFTVHAMRDLDEMPLSDTEVRLTDLTSNTYTDGLTDGNGDITFHPIAQIEDYEDTDIFLIEITGNIQNMYSCELALVSGAWLDDLTIDVQGYYTAITPTHKIGSHSLVDGYTTTHSVWNSPYQITQSGPTQTINFQCGFSSSYSGAPAGYSNADHVDIDYYLYLDRLTLGNYIQVDNDYAADSVVIPGTGDPQLDVDCNTAGTYRFRAEIKWQYFDSSDSAISTQFTSGTLTSSSWTVSYP